MLTANLGSDYVAHQAGLAAELRRLHFSLFALRDTNLAGFIWFRQTMEGSLSSFPF